MRSKSRLKAMRAKRRKIVKTKGEDSTKLPRRWVPLKNMLKAQFPDKVIAKLYDVKLPALKTRIAVLRHQFPRDIPKRTVGRKSNQVNVLLNAFVRK